MDPALIYLGIAAIVLIPCACLILAGRICARTNPPDWKKQRASHLEALAYLADVIRAGADGAADPSANKARVDAVMEIVEYPGRGDVGDWESRMVAALYPKIDEPVEP